MKISRKFRGIVNESYNLYYIKSRHIENVSEVAVIDMQNDSENKKFALPFMFVWLKNIDRVIAKADIECSHCDFIDVGCGKGVSTIYVWERFSFKTVSGFDLEPSLVAAARSNFSRCNIKKKSGDIEFSVQDAGMIVTAHPFASGFKRPA